MPLNKSGGDKARGENIAAEIRAGRPRDQAAAIAYRIQRDAKAKKMACGGRVPGYAGGGMPGAVPMAMPGAPVAHGGLLNSAVPGRTDKLKLGVKPNSYVVPADVVSALGQGNSIAGANVLGKMFKTGPYGVAAPKLAMPKTPGSPRRRFADGGMPMPDEMEMPGDGPEETGEPVDIMAAGGEFIVPADAVAMLGNGDAQAGQSILDSFVTQVRAKAIKTMRKLPGPKKS